MYRKNIFTEKELNVFKMKREGASNKDLAVALNVSESDISQTINRIKSKISTVQDSIELLTSIGVFSEGQRYELTQKGREMVSSMLERRKRRTEKTLQTYLVSKDISGFDVISIDLEDLKTLDSWHDRKRLFEINTFEGIYLSLSR